VYLPGASLGKNLVANNNLIETVRFLADLCMAQGPRWLWTFSAIPAA